MENMECVKVETHPWQLLFSDVVKNIPVWKTVIQRQISKDRVDIYYIQ